MQERSGLEADRVAGNSERFCRFAHAPVAGAGGLLATVAPANILAVGLADTDEHIRGKLTGRKMALPPVVEHVLLRHIRPRAWAVLGQHVCSVELINIHMAIRSLQRPSPSRACRNLFTFRACPKRVYAPRRTCRGQEPSFSPRACQRNSRPQGSRRARTPAAPRTLLPVCFRKTPRIAHTERWRRQTPT